MLQETEMRNFKAFKSSNSLAVFQLWIIELQFQQAIDYLTLHGHNENENKK